MDPVTLIVTALGAGAGAGLKDTASSAIKDAYQGLKTLVRKRFAGRPAAEVALAEHETDPDVWQAPLTAELTRAGAASDETLIAAAQALMTLIDAAGSQSGKYTVDVRGSQGVQVGDSNTQHNVFHPSPRPPE
jgi:hypothetical protein